jgi:hypothetical protein
MRRGDIRGAKGNGSLFRVVADLSAKERYRLQRSTAIRQCQIEHISIALMARALAPQFVVIVLTLNEFDVLFVCQERRFLLSGSCTAYSVREGQHPSCVHGASRDCAAWCASLRGPSLT